MNVIFDMDGLMFDTERIFIQAWDYAGEKMGIGKAGFMTMRTLGMNINMANNLWQEEFGNLYDLAALRKYTKEFLTNYYAHHQVPVKRGLHVLLKYLSENNVKMAVATSSPRWEVEHHLKDDGVFEYFETIVCGDMINHSKPDPEIYFKVCDIMNIKPEEAYALEDSKSGLLSAYHAGCKPIMIPDLWQPNEEILKIIVGKYDDLEAVKNAFVHNKLMI